MPFKTLIEHLITQIGQLDKAMLTISAYEDKAAADTPTAQAASQEHCIAAINLAKQAIHARCRKLGTLQAVSVDSLFKEEVLQLAGEIIVLASNLQALSLRTQNAVIREHAESFAKVATEIKTDVNAYMADSHTAISGLVVGMR